MLLRGVTAAARWTAVTLVGAGEPGSRLLHLLYGLCHPLELALEARLQGHEAVVASTAKAAMSAPSVVADGGAGVELPHAAGFVAVGPQALGLFFAAQQQPPLGWIARGPNSSKANTRSGQTATAPITVRW